MDERPTPLGPALVVLLLLLLLAGAISWFILKDV